MWLFVLTRWSTYNDCGNPCERVRKVCLRNDESTHKFQVSINSPSFRRRFQLSQNARFLPPPLLLLPLLLLYTCPFDVLHVHWIVPFTETNPTERIRKKKKKTKRSIGISSRANYPRRWPRRLLDFSHKFFDWSVNDGDDKISIPPSMSHFQLCAYVASGAVATPCVAFIDPADTRRRRSGKVWNIDARIKHPCNFSPLFLFFSFFLFFPSFFSSFKPDKSCEFWGKKMISRRGRQFLITHVREISRDQTSELIRCCIRDVFFFFFSFFSTIIEPRRIRLPLISKALETRD